MKQILALLTVLSLHANAQSDEAGIRQAISNLFDGMRKGDTTLLRSAFTQQPVLQTVINRQGNVTVLTEPLDSFIVQVAHPHKDVYDERIQYDGIKIDGDLASVWTPYKFYLGTQFSHCGIDSYQLVREGGVWKIQYLIDTRRKQNCN
jgi:hypothetical protein